jgi:hypothetical protein
MVLHCEQCWVFPSYRKRDPHKPKSGKDNVYMEEDRKGNNDKKCGG